MAKRKGGYVKDGRRNRISTNLNALFSAKETEKGEDFQRFQRTLKLMISAEHSKYELLDILMTLLNEYVDLTEEKGLNKLMDQYPKLALLIGRSVTMTIIEAKEREENEG